MSNLDRRKLLGAGIGLMVPLGALSLFSGCEQTKDDSNNNDDSSKVGKTEKSDSKKTDEKSKGKNMQIRYLEIVTPDVDALCKQYSAMHDATFGEPVPNLGNARTAELNGGGVIAIRGPMRETETPVIRPYVLVENIEKAVAAAAEAGAEIAIPSMEIPGHGTIAIVIQGGIECGLWQD